MKLQRLNVVKETEDPKKIAKLIALGYQEVKADDQTEDKKKPKPANPKPIGKGSEAQATALKEAAPLAKQSSQTEAPA